VTVRARTGRRATWAILTTMLVMSAGAIGYLRYYHAPAKNQGASGFVRLDAVHKGGTLEIGWDVKAVGDGQRGVLDIQDGALRAQIVLDEQTLKAGFVSYAHKSDVTGFQLRVERGDGTAVEGSTTFVAPQFVTPRGIEPAAAVESASAEPARPEPVMKAAVVATPPAAKPVETLKQPPPAKPVDRGKPVEAATVKPTPAPVKATEAAAVKPTPAPPRQFTPLPQTPRTTAERQVTLAEPPPPLAPQAMEQAANLQVIGQQSMPQVSRAPQQQPAAPKPQAPTAVRPNMQLAGRWVLQPGMASRSPGTPESVAITMTESNGALQGTVDARYRGGKSNRQNFSFSGRMANGAARFPWTSRDGQRGQIEFIRVPNSPDVVEVVWYGPDSKEVFDHLVRKVN